jgi:transposase-like protein
MQVAKNSWTSYTNVARTGLDCSIRVPTENEGGAKLATLMDAFINIVVEALAEPQPRREELHMDKVQPAYMLELFKARIKKSCFDYPQLYKCVDGKDVFYFHDTTFRRRWTERLRSGEPRLVLRKHKGCSSKCNACCRCDRRMLLSITPEDRTFWKSQKKLHLLFVFWERVKLNERELIADLDCRTMHIIMDGWDSMKTVVPNYASPQAELTGMYKHFLKTKLSGILVTGWRLVLCRTFPWVKSGANLACTAFIYALAMFQEDSRKSNGGRLPTSLELLVDGGPENVNHTLLGVLAWLVTKGVFQYIDLRRLPVGHTHNALDQRFQKPSLWFHGNSAHEAHTPAEWLSEVRPNIYPLQSTTKCAVHEST